MQKVCKGCESDFLRISAQASSSSFGLFVVSFMQKGVCIYNYVYIGHTALALTLGFQVFS